MIRQIVFTEKEWEKFIEDVAYDASRRLYKKPDAWMRAHGVIREEMDATLKRMESEGDEDFK